MKVKGSCLFKPMSFQDAGKLNLTINPYRKFDSKWLKYVFMHKNATNPCADGWIRFLVFCLLPWDGKQILYSASTLRLHVCSLI